MSKSKKSVFNRPMREVKAKKVLVKKQPAIDIDKAIDRGRAGVSAVHNLREIVSIFKEATGEQDIKRAAMDLFLQDLDAAINRIAEVFEP